MSVEAHFLVEVSVELFLESYIGSYVLWFWNFFFGPAERIVPPFPSACLNLAMYNPGMVITQVQE